MKCNHDCFNCKLPECTAPENVITPWESEMLKGASGKWERDMIDKNVSYMLSHGYKGDEICGMLGLSQQAYNISHARIKKTALLLEQKKRYK